MRDFVGKRFERGAWLGLHLTVGAVVIFIATVLFAEIAWRTGAHSHFAQTDKAVASWFHNHLTPAGVVAARTASFFGSVLFVAGAACVAAVLLLRTQMWNRLMLVVLATAGGGLLNLALKHVFHRNRPVLENPLVTLSSYGFPSGHTMGATIFYGLLALLALGIWTRPIQRAATICAAALLVGAIGCSRIYLGAHFLSDVLGAFAAGIAWLAFSWTGLEMIRRKQRLSR